MPKKISLHLCANTADRARGSELFAKMTDVKILGTSPSLGKIKDDVPQGDLIVSFARRASLIEEIRRFTGPPIFVLASAKDLDRAWECIEAGASGGALIGQDSDSLAQIEEALRRTAKGGSGLTVRLLDRAFCRLAELGSRQGRFTPRPPTRREIQILESLDQGWGNQKIAEEFGTSPSTVKNQLSEIYKNLGVRHRRAAIVSARRFGWIGEGDSP